MNANLSETPADRLIMGGGPKSLPSGSPLSQVVRDSFDIIDLILDDHSELKEHIEILKNTDLRRSEKQNVLEEFVPLLLSHAKAEQQSLYCALKANASFKENGYEGETEHTIAEELAHEINRTSDDDEWAAKVKVLAELVFQHIKKEETEILTRFKNNTDDKSRSFIGEEYSKLKLDYDLLLRKRDAR